MEKTKKPESINSGEHNGIEDTWGVVYETKGSLPLLSGPHAAQGHSTKVDVGVFLSGHALVWLTGLHPDIRGADSWSGRSPGRETHRRPYPRNLPPWALGRTLEKPNRTRILELHKSLPKRYLRYMRRLMGRSRYPRQFSGSPLKLLPPAISSGGIPQLGFPVPRTLRVVFAKATTSITVRLLWAKCLERINEPCPKRSVAWAQIFCDEKMNKWNGVGGTFFVFTSSQERTIWNHVAPDTK